MLFQCSSPRQCGHVGAKCWDWGREHLSSFSEHLCRTTAGWGIGKGEASRFVPPYLLLMSLNLNLTQAIAVFLQLPRNTPTRANRALESAASGPLSPSQSRFWIALRRYHREKASFLTTRSATLLGCLNSTHLHSWIFHHGHSLPRFNRSRYFAFFILRRSWTSRGRNSSSLWATCVCFRCANSAAPWVPNRCRTSLSAALVFVAGRFLHRQRTDHRSHQLSQADEPRSLSPPQTMIDLPSKGKTAAASGSATNSKYAWRTNNRSTRAECGCSTRRTHL